MPPFRHLLRCVAEALGARGARGLAEVVPFGAVLYDVAADAWERLREQQLEDELRGLVGAAAGASPAEARAEAEAVAREVGADQPAAVRDRLALYLAGVPAVLRQSLRRPADPDGRSLPLSFGLRRPEDLLQLLPARLPRFRAGDRAPGQPDWELAELLGVGGFGEVWLARHATFDGIAPVALKFCLDPEARDRLLRHEAVVLNHVLRHGRHPGIVPLLDASLNTDPPCLKYEYVGGGDLSGLVRDWQAGTDGPRWRLATGVLLGLARIVGFAHALTPPIVHRDLKPANVLVQRDEGGYRLRVTDFGIGAVAALPSLQDARQATTTRGDLLGTALRGSHTPLYASPGQIRGEPADPRDDVHALGVIWYQLLTGDLQSGAPTGLWADELEEAGLPRDLVRLLGACVAGRAERRPADAGALADALARSLAAEPVAAPCAAPAEADPSA